MNIKYFLQGVLAGLRSFGLTLSTYVNSALLLLVFIIGVGGTKLYGVLRHRHFLPISRTKSKWVKRGEEPEDVADYKKMY